MSRTTGGGEVTGLLFITGTVKTASSSLVGLLNRHPDIFILYDTALAADPPTRRARLFLAKFPDARPFFRPGEDLVALYSEFESWLASRGYRYRIFGDKVLSLSVDVLHRLSARPVIYCVRDLRTWLVKRQVRQSYLVEDNVVPAAVLFCRQFLESFRLPWRLHMSAEQFVERNDEAIASVERFLGLDLADVAEAWWDKLGEHEPGDPKSAIDWWERHGSSTVRPQRLDVAVELRDHPFWDELLPVFDRYYHALNTEVDASQLDADLAFLQSLLDREPVSLRDAYAKVETLEPVPSAARHTLLGRARDAISRARA
jgi:hypothetical protein